MSRDRTIRLGAIGIVAGAFSGLFGVGGGTVMVPLLAAGERRATATSLCAIVLIAGLAAAAQGVYGNVDIGDALILVAPAIVGVGAGVAIQQRISERSVSVLFSLLLIGIAVELIVP